MVLRGSNNSCLCASHSVPTQELAMLDPRLPSKHSEDWALAPSQGSRSCQHSEAMSDLAALKCWHSSWERDAKDSFPLLPWTSSSACWTRAPLPLSFPTWLSVTLTHPAPHPWPWLLDDLFPEVDSCCFSVLGIFIENERGVEWSRWRDPVCVRLLLHLESQSTEGIHRGKENWKTVATNQQNEKLGMACFTYEQSSLSRDTNGRQRLNFSSENKVWH